MHFVPQRRELVVQWLGNKEQGMSAPWLVKPGALSPLRFSSNDRRECLRSIAPWEVHRCEYESRRQSPGRGTGRDEAAQRRAQSWNEVEGPHAQGPYDVASEGAK